jgi:hypothetical protein
MADGKQRRSWRHDEQSRGTDKASSMEEYLTIGEVAERLKLKANLQHD